MENVKIEDWLRDNSSGSGSGSGSGDGSGYDSGSGYGSGDGFGSGDGSGSGSGSGYDSGYGSGDGFGFGDGSGYGSGDGFGSGYGSGDGFGFGDGSGSGCGDGFGDGSGSGSGSGYGFGSGDGSGSGCGDGFGDGSGYGSGDGFGFKIKSVNGVPVYIIDGVPTIITALYLSMAKGFIINNDFSRSACYVAKGDGYFAHGETAQEAADALRKKIFKNMDTDEAIRKFLATFKSGEKYPGRDFFEWHHYLTGSCKMGRESFVKNHGINLDDSFTVEEFIKITENDFGRDTIKQLKEQLKTRKG